ncbi:MAG: lipopolysaccharide biosynthesis protein [Novosphingobium sp.]|nr:lipopolysaccharide biosynthesis protein [Novosphingobium sp.]
MNATRAAAPSFRDQVRSAVIWRSGTQIAAQLIAWGSTFLVIRILAPADYGLYAMSVVVLTLLNLMNGYGLANALIRKREVTRQMLRQLFGMLVVLNAALAALQFAAAPWVADYYDQPIVADILRAQALIYLTNPFLALGYAILSREMDFRRQARVNVASALIGAAVALGGALAGLGVWTLVLAPLAMFASRALGMAIAARAFMLPSFDFRGAGGIAGFGGMVALSSLLYFVQTQADIVIAGRVLDPHALGLYTTALFLAQIFVNKVVPPLNEVAFAAYARVQDDRALYAKGFLTAARTIMLLAAPFCFGLAATAEPLVEVVLGAKWRAAAPLLALLALAMPVMTLQVLFAPATNAVGRPGLATRSAALGAVVMPLAFLVGVQWGAVGVAAAWLAAYPLLTAVTAAWSLPAIGVRARALGEAILAPLLAGAAMAAAVVGVDRAAAVLPPAPRLGLLIAVGSATYLGWLLTFARPRLIELAELVRGR